MTDGRRLEGAEPFRTAERADDCAGPAVTYDDRLRILLRTLRGDRYLPAADIAHLALRLWAHYFEAPELRGKLRYLRDRGLVGYERGHGWTLTYPAGFEAARLLS